MIIVRKIVIFVCSNYHNLSKLRNKKIKNKNKNLSEFKIIIFQRKLNWIIYGQILFNKRNILKLFILLRKLK